MVLEGGDVRPSDGAIPHSDKRNDDVRVRFSLDGIDFNLNLVGEFNLYNVLAAIAVAKAYKIDLRIVKQALEKIKMIPGRMEFINHGQPFNVVVDYAHTPDSLEAVYTTLKPISRRLICVFGATGGGRDIWKRPEFGKIAEHYCDRVILTDEDPYDENPEKIIKDIEKGFLNQVPREYSPREYSGQATGNKGIQYEIILDRREAIKKALTYVENDDTVIITGKGSEPVMALPHGKKIPWSDKEIVLEHLKK